MNKKELEKEIEKDILDFGEKLKKGEALFFDKFTKRMKKLIELMKKEIQNN